MPKKPSGENTKAAAARQRKQAEKKTKLSSSSDSETGDIDRKLLQKQQKKEKEELKKQQKIDRKAENRATLEAELKTIKVSKSNIPSKLTRNQIDRNKTLNKSMTIPSGDHSRPLEENLNKTSKAACARNVDQALAILSDSKPDHRPEKRKKALHLAYEERRLRELKIEKPTLRLTQMKEIIFKEWKNHPDNPLNQI